MSNWVIMKVIKGLGYLAVLWFFTSCVEHYYPGADEKLSFLEMKPGYYSQLNPPSAIETQRLSYGYSLLIRQHSMDPPDFWPLD
jgi:hypothetical protein